MRTKRWDFLALLLFNTCSKVWIDTTTSSSGLRVTVGEIETPVRLRLPGVNIFTIRTNSLYSSYSCPLYPVSAPPSTPLSIAKTHDAHNSPTHLNPAGKIHQDS